MTDLVYILNSEELPLFALSADMCSFGPATGLARTSQCLSAVSTCLSPLRLQKASSGQSLAKLGVDRLGTYMLFHSTIAYKAHRLDQDVRRLRLLFFPIHSCCFFSRVHSDATSLRECTAKRGRFHSHAEAYRNGDEDLDK